MRIWIDVSSGTYGDADDLVFVDISDWSNDEVTSFSELSDGERSELAYEISQLQGENDGI
jgi:hypothetical protein